MKSTTIEITVKERVEVLPCPNIPCQSVRVELALDNHHNKFNILCADCGMSGPMHSDQMPAIKSWNDLLRAFDRP